MESKSVEDYTAEDFANGFNADVPTYVTKAVNEQSSSYHSQVWEYFNFIHEVSNGKVIKNWYKCSAHDCQKPYVMCKLAGGNSTLKRHLRRLHSIELDDKKDVNKKKENENANIETDKSEKIVGKETSKREEEEKDAVYTLKPCELLDALAKASLLGHRYGTISIVHFQQYLVNFDEKWSPNFFDEIERILSINGIKNLKVSLDRLTKNEIMANRANSNSSVSGNTITNDNESNDHSEAEKQQYQISTRYQNRKK